MRAFERHFLPPCPYSERVRGDGDGWVLSDNGAAYWGKHGAAGLLLRAPGPDGSPVGRLIVNMQPAWGKDQTPTYLMQVTARGYPLGPGSPGVTAFLDLAHDWIVEGFTAITTRSMHDIWEMQ